MSEMKLTAAMVAKVQRTEPDEGPRPHLLQMDEADYAQWTDDLLQTLGDAPLRVFAYGSLIWKPEFDHMGQSHATLHGWHRSFCMKIERWRGTRAFPGLMMALDRGGSCKGVVYELPPHGKPAQIKRLLEREMTNKPPTNMPRIVTVEADGTEVKAMAFVSSRSGERYVGKKPLPEVAHILSRAAGHWGTGAEYLFNTVSHLEQLGIHDRNLWALQELVAQEIEGM
ncbi:MAG: gamma-glutamylcyclotransferase [Alphaproteobacteria bacterium]|nr:gamma-glutamylcyclotransferase [Alphaproteobacteria bacterium]